MAPSPTTPIAGGRRFLTVADVAVMLSPRETPVAHSRVYAWVRVGVSVRGKRIKLEAVQLPGGMVFTPEAVEDFIARLSAPHAQAAAPRLSRALGRREAPGAVGVHRCADEEIGTYPEPTRRLRLAPSPQPVDRLGALRTRPACAGAAPVRKRTG